MMNDKYRKKLFDKIIIGCDHSKSSHWIRFYRHAKGKSKVYQIRNNEKGFKRLFKLLGEFKDKYGGSEVLFVSEPTGSYGLPLLRYSGSRGVTVVQINPKHTKRIREISDNSPNKTDKKDPDVIINAFVFGTCLSVRVKAPDKANLKELVGYREELLTRVNQHLNRLESRLATSFPEYLSVMNGLDSKTSRYLLKKYQTAERMARMQVEDLEREIRRVSRGRLGKKRALELHHSAKRSIGINDASDAMEWIFKQQLSSLEDLYNQLAEVEKKIREELSRMPEAGYIMSIKGISIVTTAVIITEIGDFNSFSSRSKILKYAGLNLYEVSSGKSRGRRRITKRGRSLLRKTLYFTTLNTIRKGGVFHQLYKEKKQEGMKKMMAITMISRKILRIAYSLVKNQENFNATFHFEQIKKGKQQENKAA